MALEAAVAEGVGREPDGRLIVRLVPAPRRSGTRGGVGGAKLAMPAWIPLARSARISAQAATPGSKGSTIASMQWDRS